MQKISAKYILSDEEIKEHPFIKNGRPDFYHFVAPIFCESFNVVNSSINCTKINVASNIQDSWFEALPEDMSEMSLAMLLLDKGPKVDHDLKYNQIEIFEGFIYG